MEMNNVITDKMDEKIYSANDTISKEDITHILYYFFDEVVKRKRRSLVEGGLHAGLVATKDGFAAKISEGDGKCSHFSTSINLVKFLKGDGFFITERGLGTTSLYKDALNDLFTSSIESRIVAGDRELLMSFVSNKGVLSEFQVDLLQSIADSCKLLIDNGILDDVSLGLRVGQTDLKIDNWDDKQYKLLCDTIDSERKRIPVTNRKK